MELQTPKGTRDFPPEEKILKDRIVNTLKSVFELYGYAPLETPILERYDVLASKYAGGTEILKETFKLKDQGQRELALRYDLTVPFSRFIGMNLNLKMPFKRYQIGEVFRDGPVASARYRQFTQCDVDVAGSSSLILEAELVSIIYSAFKKLGMKCIVKFNNRKRLNEILDYCGVEKSKQDGAILSIDKLGKFGIDAVKKELKQQDISDDKILKIVNLLIIKGSNDEKIRQLKNVMKKSNGLLEIEELLKFCSNLGLEPEFDFALARGLSYYTGTIIETFLEESSVKSAVCSGGRYDNMIGAFLGKGNYPAVGISFGLDRIYDALAEKEKTVSRTTAKLYIIPINTLNESMKICQKFRDAGINTDIDSMGRGPSKNLEFANSLGIPFVAFIGKKELDEGKIKLRDMKSGNEEMVKFDDAVLSMKF